MQLLPYKRQKLFLSLEALSFGTLPVGTAAEQLIVVYSTSHVRQRTRTDAPTRLCLKQSGESAVAVSIGESRVVLCNRCLGLSPSVVRRRGRSGSSGL